MSPTERKSKHDPDNLPGSYERRVFVGGNYDFMATLRKIKDLVNKTGFVGILAYDFDVPEEQTHDFDLRLLHGCKYAVFEETSPAGELMELERAARDYNKTIFVVYQVRDSGSSEIPPQVSIMVKSLNLPMFGYATFEELEQFVSRTFSRIEEEPITSWIEILRMVWLPPQVKSLLIQSLETQLAKQKGDVT